jgi:hypothetical protein
MAIDDEDLGWAAKLGFCWRISTLRDYEQAVDG